MSGDTAKLARGIDDSLVTLPDVRDTYSARPVATRVLTLQTDGDAPRAVVNEKRGGLEITVNIGVAAAADSAQVAEEAAAVVRALTVAETGEEATHVTVRVSRLIPDG